jgi:hypothetical protein
LIEREDGDSIVGFYRPDMKIRVTDRHRFHADRNLDPTFGLDADLVPNPDATLNCARLIIEKCVPAIGLQLDILRIFLKASLR